MLGFDTCAMSGFDNTKLDEALFARTSWRSNFLFTLALQSHFLAVLNQWATMIQKLMTGGSSIEDTLALWASSLRKAKRRIRLLFTQDCLSISADQFLDTLLGNEPRKTGWMCAEAAGDSGPWRQQALLGRGRWDADALRDIVRDHVIEGSVINGRTAAMG
jgi:hypothetical protein